jgi:hypothetical protein
MQPSILKHLAQNSTNSQNIPFPLRASDPVSATALPRRINFHEDFINPSSLKPVDGNLVPVLWRLVLPIILPEFHLEILLVNCAHHRENIEISIQADELFVFLFDRPSV